MLSIPFLLLRLLLTLLLLPLLLKLKLNFLKLNVPSVPTCTKLSFCCLPEALAPNMDPPLLGG